MEAKSNSIDQPTDSGEDSPVGRRIAVLRKQWRDFAALPDARLLRWSVHLDELPLIHALSELENDERASDRPEVFLRFEEPFESSTRHGFTLRESWTSAYDACRDELSKEGMVADWVCPALVAGQSDTDTLAKACAAFLEHHAEELELLVLVLLPEHIADEKAWALWLGRLMHSMRLLAVRVIVVDRRENPILAALAKEHPAKVKTMTPNLDMASVQEEISAAAGRLDTPGGAFRHHFVKLSRAIGEGDWQKAESLAAPAIEIAMRESWPQLAAAVHLTMGSAFSAQKQHPEAIKRYRQAESLAVEAENAQDPTGRQLRIQSRLAIGGELLAAKAYDKAGVYYETTAPLTKDDMVPQIHLECWRMASLCYECAELPDKSWDVGMKALEVGAAMDQDTRNASTLPFVGEALLRMAKRGARQHYVKAIESQMETLLGKDWRSQIEAIRGTER